MSLELLIVCSEGRNLTSEQLDFGLVPSHLATDILEGQLGAVEACGKSIHVSAHGLKSLFDLVEAPSEVGDGRLELLEDLDAAFAGADGVFVVVGALGRLMAGTSDVGLLVRGHVSVVHGRFAIGGVEFWA